MSEISSRSENPPNARFNFTVLAGDVSCFFIGTAFLDSATALPVVVRHLGGGLALLGILGAIRQGAYYLPQLFVAHRLHSLVQYKPILLVITFCGRIGYFVAAILILLFGKSQPYIGLWALIVAYTLAWLGDGGGGVPWTALVGRTIPMRQRGVLFSATQVIGGIVKLGVAAIVTHILSGTLTKFPVSEGMLVLGCAVFMGISWGFLAAIREPSAVLPDKLVNTPSFTDFLKELPVRLRERPEFGRLALTQILASASITAAPFLWIYVSTATSPRLPASDAGKFLFAQTVGLLIFSPIWGIVSDRFGPRQALSFVFGVSLCWVLLAFGGALLGGNILFFYAAYFVYGGVVDSWTLITNYLLESIPEDSQPTYIGLMNAFSLPALLVPLLAGFCATRFGSASTLLLAGGLLASALIVIRTLPNTRAKESSAKR